MAHPNAKLELPSITMKKQKDWAEMEALYNTSYNNLSGVVATVGAVVSMKDNLPDGVSIEKLTNMVNALNKNIETLRSELNNIYQQVQQSKASDMDMMDINMECIQIASQYVDWGHRFATLCGQPIGDIITYVEQ